MNDNHVFALFMISNDSRILRSFYERHAEATEQATLMNTEHTLYVNTQQIKSINIHFEVEEMSFAAALNMILSSRSPLNVLGLG